MRLKVATRDEVFPQLEPTTERCMITFVLSDRALKGSGGV